MPKKGFKTITVADKVFDKFYKKYDKERDEFKEKGIFSFSAYITKILLDTKEKQHLKNITEMQVITNSLLIGMFEHMLGGNKEDALDGLYNLKTAMMHFVKDMQEDSRS